MNAYIKILDELTRHKNVKYTFTDRDDTFLIYVFFKDDTISPLEILAEINLMVNKLNLCDFRKKKSSCDYEYNNENFLKDVYVYRALDIEGNNVKVC